VPCSFYAVQFVPKSFGPSALNTTLRPSCVYSLDARHNKSFKILFLSGGNNVSLFVQSCSCTTVCVFP
jgi:hypothetical protein